MTILIYPFIGRQRYTVLILVLSLALTACAFTPSKPPECEGPWSPINPPAATQ